MVFIEDYGFFFLTPLNMIRHAEFKNDMVNQNHVCKVCVCAR